MQFYYPFHPESPCPECGQADTIIDAAQGDAVCRACGLVRASHLVSDEAEFRCFSDDFGQVQDKSRLGPPAAAGEHDAAALPASKIAHNPLLDRLNRSCCDRDKSPKVSADFFRIAEDVLHIPRTVSEDAVAMFKATVRDIPGSHKCRIRPAAMEAVCVFYACKRATHLRLTKTKEQVCAAFGVQMPTFVLMNNTFALVARTKPWLSATVTSEEAPAMLPVLLRHAGLHWTAKQRADVSNSVAALYRSNRRYTGSAGPSSPS
ncbi:hypothetical protein OEZ85_011045 [Tetradesmus obliquus]|uniref:TFIIB-type domain-containing protein n=1 Tax=Tetradesmus obliquus TaxID=3088 RepID=A0ABY8TPS7_TETOB|nr:hypothetical protein OEZ85_011045 [Tetradesmus obliquus]